MDTATAERPQTVAEHIEAETPARLPPDVPAVPAPVVPSPAAVTPAPASETPEQEADSHRPDADVSDAARTLRKNRQQERTARVRQENDELARELQRRRELRSEIERSAPAPSRTADGPSAGSTFQFPEYATWAVGQNEGKPFEAFLDARDDARDAWKAHISRTRVVQESRQQHVSQQVQTLDQMQKAGGEKFADFDTVVLPFVESLRGNPRAADIADFLASSDVGSDLSYRVAKDPEVRKAVLTATSHGALVRALRDAETAILAPKQAPKPKTNAPTPPSQTVGGGATATDDDENKRTTGEHLRKRAAEDAEPRRVRSWR